MPYTLAKFFLWGLLMALAGGVIGWLLRSLTCRVQLANARRTNVDGDELDRLRGRVANLEPLVAERDRLRMELADVRGSSGGVLGFASSPDSSGPIAPNTTRQPEKPPEPSPEPLPDRPPPDVSEATAVLGTKITLDDLTVIEGIGPKIAELCTGIGVSTWRQLSATDVVTLQTMLDAAGPRFQLHQPESWPQQAGLLAEGRWAEFQQFTADLRGAT